LNKVFAKNFSENSVKVLILEGVHLFIVRDTALKHHFHSTSRGELKSVLAVPKKNFQTESRSK
jgi:hypothetical protein